MGHRKAGIGYSGNRMLLPCTPAGVKRINEDIVTDRRLDSLP